MFIKIRKPTQVGVTTSLIKVARRRGLSVAVLEPTNKIIDDTVVKQFRSRNTRVAKIGRNQFMCPNSKVDPVFGWDTRGNCNECTEDKDECGYWDVKDGEYDILGMTYDKFLALVNGYDSFGMLDLLLEKDVIILDEIATTLTYSNDFDLIKVISDLAGLKHIKYDDLKVRQARALDKIYPVLDSIKKLSQSIPKGEGGVFPNPQVMSFNEVHSIGEQLIKLVSEKYKDDFRRFLLTVTHNDIIIVNTNKGARVMPKQDTFTRIFMDKIYEMIGERLANDKSIDSLKVFITGAKMPDTKDFSNFVEVTMPDYNETEKQRLIVCDKANWNFEENWSREKKKVKTVLEKLTKTLEGEPILVIAINKEIAKDIASWELEDVNSEEYMYYTHYRSEDTAGVRLPYRIVVCVGMPWTPESSYGTHDIMYSEAAGTFRDIEMADTFKNAVGEAKIQRARSEALYLYSAAEWKT